MVEVFRGRLVLTDCDEPLGPAVIVVKDGKVDKVLKETLEIPDKIGPIQKVVEAGDLVLMPGLVDSHVHVNEPGRTEWEGYWTATRSAAASGITTIVDMPLNSIPPTTTVENFEIKLAAAKDKCHVDVAFWGGVVPDNVHELRPLLARGIRGFKCFLINSGVDEFPCVSIDEAAKALQKLQGTEAVLLFHAELEVATTTTSSQDLDPQAYETFLKSRPAQMEDNAIREIIRLCRETGVRTHIVHLASGHSVDVLAEARKDGVPITAETCHHYLNLTAETVPNASAEFKCCPPIREEWHREKLWEAIQKDVVSMVVSDHAPCTADLKLPSNVDFMTAWGGISSLQFCLPLMWTSAVKRGFGINDISRLMAKNTSKLAGLDRSKGSLKPGCDADMVIWDPNASFSVTKENVLHKNKLTPYIGWELRGVVHETIVRGKTVFKNGQFHYDNESPLGTLLLDPRESSAHLSTVPNKTDDNKPTPMDEESLYRAFRQFKYKSKDEGPIFVSDTLTRHAFNTDAQNLKWLSVGCGFGDMEELLFKITPGLRDNVDLLECYEPGKVQFSYLSKMDFRLDNGKKIILHNEPYHGETQPSVIEAGYDIITLFHVHYYWRTPSERRSIFQNLLGRLNNNGILFLITVDQGKNHQLHLRGWAKNEYVGKSIKALVDSRDIAKEILTAAMNMKPEVRLSQMIQPYDLRFPVDLVEVKEAASVSHQVLSYILGFEFSQLSATFQDQVISWIRSECEHDNQDLFWCLQASSTMTFIKK